MHVVCHSQTFPSVALRSTAWLSTYTKEYPHLLHSHCLYINCLHFANYTMACTMYSNVATEQYLIYVPISAEVIYPTYGAFPGPEVLSFSLEILKQPKKMVSKMSALGLKHVGPVGMGVGAWGKHGFFRVPVWGGWGKYGNSLAALQHPKFATFS